MKIGIDVGGTKTLVCLFQDADSYRPKLVAERKFLNSNSFEIDFANLIAEIRSIAGSKEIDGIGITLPGILNESKTTILDSDNLSSWQGYDVRNLLINEFATEVRTNHDVVCGGRGEFLYGAGKGADEIYFLAWGTGIGGCFINRTTKGIIAKQAEVGWQFVNGKRLESLVDGAGIKRRFGKAAENISEEEWSQVIDDLAQAINNIVMITGVSKIVMGGGISTKQIDRLPQLEQLANDKLDFLKVELIPAELGQYSAAYGAYSLL